MHYRREIDGLRALAVLPVILFHAGTPGFGGGFVGVDVFFVISGFLITGLLLEDLSTGRLSIRRFYERRARRILPALFVVMGACLAPAWLLLSPGELRDFGRSLLAVSLFGSNLLFWQQSGYFETASELKPLLHTWSLAVEEQFYLLFPLLLAWSARHGLRHTSTLLGALSLGSLVLAQLMIQQAPVSAFYLLPARAWELGLGALLALWQASRPAVPEGRLGEVGAVAGLGMVVAAVVGFDKETPFPGVYALLPTLGTCLLLQFASPRTATGRLLGKRPVVAIGLVSYSAYLWHFPLFAFARHATDDRPGQTILLGLALVCLMLAALSWRFIEQPLRDRHRVGTRTVLRLGVGAASVFMLFGLACLLGKGFPTLRLDDAQRAVLETAMPSPKRETCHTEGTHYLQPDASCRYFSAQPSWAVFGDSHAVEMAYGLAEELRGQQDGVAHFSFSGCAPVFGTETSPVPGCADWTRDAITAIAKDPQIRRVVVVFRLNAALFGRHEETYPDLPDQHTNAERGRVWRAYLGLLQAFVAQGKQVYAVLQAPELPKPIDELVRRASTPSEVSGVTRAWWNARSDFVTKRLSDLPPEVVVVDPALRFCDEARCLAVHRGIARYFDDDHYSVAGAREVAREILAHSASEGRGPPH